MSIDYKVGDWVETCHIMPGIVQNIIPKEDTVEVFYPHYKEKYPSYTGGSCCSLTHCGVHYIDSELANAFLKIGEERSTKVWHFLQRNFHIYGIERNITFWDKVVKEIETRPNSVTFCRKEYAYKERKEMYEKYHKAWDDFHILYHQTIKDLANDIINDTTKGIWLSYQKHTIKSIKNGIRIIELVKTGEQFLVKKTRKRDCRMKLRTRYQIIKKIK